MKPKEKMIVKGGRRRKYVLRVCEHCKSVFYTRSDNKNVSRCKNCSHAHLRKPNVKCYVDGCNDTYYSKGLCQFHYDRKYRGTKLNEGYYGRKKIDFEINENGCFICTTLVPVEAGYYMTTRDGEKEYLHRMIYRECFGDIPEGLLIRHKCDNPSCINPEHLETGTHQENMQDAVDRKRNAYGERNGRAKLKEVEVLEIIDLLKRGRTQKSIAGIYGVSPDTIQAIKSGKNWRHLTCHLTEN